MPEPIKEDRAEFVLSVAKKSWIIDSVHRTNDTIRREYWEKRWGMVKEEETKIAGISMTMVLFAILSLGLAVSIYVYQNAAAPAAVHMS
jgi:hypothetical protein